MKKQNKNGLCKAFFWVAVLVLLTVNLSAFIYYNDTEIGFGMGEKSGSQESAIIKGYLLEGAGHFLGSYSDFILFFKKIEVAELAGLDYNEVRMILNNAIEEMGYARDIYTRLKAEADVTPYNPDVINELLNFNYDKFRKKNQLIEPIFDQVKYYLQNEQIREMYGKALSDMDNVLKIAGVIKTKIDIGDLPGMATMLDLDETLAKSLRFGQYAARVFAEIK